MIFVVSGVHTHVLHCSHSDVTLRKAEFGWFGHRWQFNLKLRHLWHGRSLEEVMLGLEQCVLRCNDLESELLVPSCGRKSADAKLFPSALNAKTSSSPWKQMAAAHYPVRWWKGEERPSLGNTCTSSHWCSGSLRASGFVYQAVPETEETQRFGLPLVERTTCFVGKENTTTAVRCHPTW